MHANGFPMAPEPGSPALALQPAPAAHAVPTPVLLGGAAAPDLAALHRARRILVLGSSGAGKTQLSLRLGEILGLEAVHLDAHFWQPGARPRADGEWHEITSELVQRDTWIMDGTYERSLHLRVPHADAIVLLDCPRRRCLERVLRRQHQAAPETRRDLAPGCEEQVDWNHVRYVWQYPVETRPKVLASLRRHAEGKPITTLHSPEAVKPFLAALSAATPVASTPETAIAA